MKCTSSLRWRRVSRREHCPICDRPDWCLVTGSVGALTAAICARIESRHAAGKAGWLHKLADYGWQADRRRTVTIHSAVPQSPAPDLSLLAARYFAAVEADHLECFAAGLGLSVESLRRLRVGWATDRFAWCFPMTDAGGKVLGIRLRAPDGRKWSVRGGREGLFIPAADAVVGERLVICEGTTDTAALLDLGFAAVGRPSCSGGIPLLVELVKRRRPAEIVIVADADAPGRRGAESLAVVMLAYSAAVRVISPPTGMKDARAWKQSGATPADVLARINAAVIRKLTIKAERMGEQS